MNSKLAKQMHGVKRIRSINKLPSYIKSELNDLAKYGNMSRTKALSIIKISKGTFTMNGKRRTIYEIEGLTGTKIVFRNNAGKIVEAQSWEELSELFWESY